MGKTLRKSTGKEGIEEGKRREEKKNKKKEQGKKEEKVEREEGKNGVVKVEKTIKPGKNKVLRDTESAKAIISKRTVKSIESHRKS